MTGVRRLYRCPLVAGGIALLAVVLTGCGSPAPKSARIAKSYGGQFSDMLSYASFGATSALDCADGKSLTVAGSNNTLTVRGSCEAVDVSGADNRITIERIGKTLTLTGLNNSVTYRNGEPKVDDRGSGNTVTARR
ncbi:DUF3060 domain-containing protein [Mycolicibacter hiberniae]|uniref:Uncharacterized protein n=1 Tax=Mycolicibacter hiberniae TaxID=29314 RepID=A0A7I7WXI6_9MYCO|nr:DUF3060 domain-containing protein [Mycolicibacter hiberniae]ORV70844.1 hypothetical protein AWC09_07995 [Mycolicibacter hiberniae]BBZ21782.1 hypothetical protein MHIB_02000 [Mycolicibacter hiberniae]